MTEKKLKKARRDLEWEQAKGRLLAKLVQCLGRNKALGMAEAFEIAFPGRSWRNRINDTRAVRDIIEDLRRGNEKKGMRPMPICSTSSNLRPGYYLPVGQELEEWLRKKEKRLIDGLGLIARLRRLALPDYLGQMALKMRGVQA